METILSQKTFTKTWWETFVKENKNFTETCLFKNTLEESVLQKLEQGMMEVLHNRFKLKEVSYNGGFRCYQNGKVISEEKALSYCDQFAATGENLESYTKRVFGDNFGMIINRTEKYSKTLTSTLNQLIQPLFDIVGVPATGIDIIPFIGSYPWTPLGIHQDSVGENVIHFHLGPGRKKMYVWNEETYQKIPGARQNNTDVEAFLPEATVYDFGRGDLFYMPWNNYHIGSSKDFSIGVTVWFNHPTKEKFLNTLLDTFIRFYFDKEKKEKLLRPSRDYLNNDTPYKEVFSALTLPKEILNKNGGDLIRHCYNDYKLSIMSNAGWQSPPLSREEEENYSLNNYPELLSKTIKSKKMFPIYYYKQAEDELVVFVRGHRTTTLHHKSLETIIDRINTNQEIAVKQLLQDFSEERGLRFLAQIYNNQGFEIV